jgi:hypothetical protein
VERHRAGFERCQAHSLAVEEDDDHGDREPDEQEREFQCDRDERERFFGRCEKRAASARQTLHGRRERSRRIDRPADVLDRASEAAAENEDVSAHESLAADRDVGAERDDVPLHPGIDQDVAAEELHVARDRLLEH